MKRFGSSLLLGAALWVCGCQSLIGLEDRELVAADGGADAAADGGTPVGPSALCVEYCDQVTESCTGEYAVYAGRPLCLEVCKHLPPGEREDATGNTIACRYQVARFITEPAVDCPAAGPGGAGRCGDNCESYCTLMDAACSEFHSPEVAACIEQCQGLLDRDTDRDNAPLDSRFSAGSPSARDHDGDTVQCRLFHASAASTPTGAIAHCWHAAIAPRPGPGGIINPCLRHLGETEPSCAGYCQLVMTACTGEQSVYEDQAQCLAVCDALPKGALTDDGSSAENTLGCRKTHGYNALVGDPIIHCPHAGPGGAGVCGDDCVSFCTQLRDACAAGFEAEYGADEAAAHSACQTQCAGLLDGQSSLRYAIASVPDEPELACRLLEVARAQAAPSDAMHCRRALGQVSCD